MGDVVVMWNVTIVLDLDILWVHSSPPLVHRKRGTKTPKDLFPTIHNTHYLRVLQMIWSNHLPFFCWYWTINQIFWKPHLETLLGEEEIEATFQRLTKLSVPALNTNWSWYRLYLTFHTLNNVDEYKIMRNRIPMRMCCYWFHRLVAFSCIPKLHLVIISSWNQIIILVGIEIQISNIRTMCGSNWITFPMKKNNISVFLLHFANKLENS